MANSVEIFVLYNEKKKEICQVQGVNDMYTNVVAYFNEDEDLDINELKEEIKDAFWATKDNIYSIVTGASFSIEGEAKDIPDIGHYKRMILTIELDEKNLMSAIKKYLK